MKKKIITAFLLLAVLISAVACIGQENEGDGETSESGAVSNGTAGTTEADPILPDDLRFDGKSYVALCRMHNSYFEDEIFIEASENEPVSEAIYNRMLEVESRFGVTVGKVEQEDMYKMNDRIRSDIMSGDPAYNIIAHFVYHAPALALEDQLYNWYDVPYVSESLQRGSDWWPSSLVDMSTINDQLYFVSGDIGISVLKTINVLFMNKTVAADKKLTGIYDTVKNGEWTLEEFTNVVTNVSEDLNGDLNYDEQDLYGFATHYFDHYFATFDIPIVEENKDGTLQMAVYTDKFINSYDRLYSLFHDYQGIYDASKIMNDKSITAKLFMNDQLLFMGHLTHQADTIRDMRSEYNILPWPKYDEAQEDYQTVSHNNYSTFCIPISVAEEDLEMVGAVTEALAQISHETVTPVYKEVVLKDKYSSDEDNKAMLDIVFDSIIFDFGITYSYTIADVGFLYRNVYKNVENISSTYDSNKEAYELALIDIMNKFSMMGD